MEYFPEVVQVIAGDEFAVVAYFSRQYDVSPHIGDGIFGPLQDREVFVERLTVMNGTVAWDIEGNRDESRCIDLDPIVVYEGSMVVPDPLEVAA